jgi:hypothetical protein
MRTNLAAAGRCRDDNGIVRNTKENTTGRQIGDDFAAAIVLGGQVWYENNQKGRQGHRKQSSRPAGTAQNRPRGESHTYGMLDALHTLHGDNSPLRYHNLK